MPERETATALKTPINMEVDDNPPADTPTIALEFLLRGRGCIPVTTATSVAQSGAPSPASVNLPRDTDCPLIRSSLQISTPQPVNVLASARLALTKFVV